MPGGVAEIFMSSPGTDIIMAKERKGHMRLALQFGMKIIPCYLFGGNDFFYNGATKFPILKKISRKLGFGLLFWYGKFFCPFIPMNPKVTIVFGEPIIAEKLSGDPRNFPQEKVDDIH